MTFYYINNIIDLGVGIIMNTIQLEKTINNLSRFIKIKEEKKQELISKYSSMKDVDVIKELAQILYSKLNNEENLFKALEEIRNINPEICPSVEKMNDILNKMFSNEIEGNMSLEENHKLVKESLIKFTVLFNQYGIDYYIVGALPCFLKIGQPLFRYHDDIDIMINEDDIPKVAKIIELSGYEFHDDRFPSLERYHEMKINKPPHTVLAQNPNNEFHLGFFCFRREKDKGITMREYSHRLIKGKVLVDVLERKSDPKGTHLRYDETPISYMGTSFKTSSIESVYNLKEYTKRPKDITDIEKLEPYINRKKLEELKSHPNLNIEIQNIESFQQIPLTQIKKL